MENVENTTVEIEKEVCVGEVVTDELATVEEKRYYVGFDKPFTFEGNTYNGIDLAPMEDLSGKQLLNISKRYKKLGGSDILPENDIEYAIIVATEVCKLPMEFFYRLPSRELVKIRIKVLGFYFHED